MNDAPDRRVIVDTQFLIWAIRKEASPGQEDRLSLARRYLAALTDSRRQIVVPAPVLAELLAGANGRQACAEEVLRSCRVVPFDAMAAMQFAEVFGTTSSDWRVEIGDKGRVRMKFDMMIIAIALATRINALLTFDDGLQNLAKRFHITIYKPQGSFSWAESEGMR